MSKRGHRSWDDYDNRITISFPCATDYGLVRDYSNSIANAADSSFDMPSALRILSIKISLLSHLSLDLDHIYQISISQLNASDASSQRSQKVAMF